MSPLSLWTQFGEDVKFCLDPSTWWRGFESDEMLEPASAFSTNTNTFSKYEIQHLVMGFESDETVEYSFSLQIQMHFRFTKYKTKWKFTWYWGLNQMRQKDIKSKWNTFTRRKIHSTGNIYERYKLSCYLSSRHYLVRKCTEHSVLCLWITLKDASDIL